MLETKGLIKVYKPKKGVPVKALDNVSIKFPEKGMVFLLGKSGSGKSTLLNVLGGLDRYDGGEIIIKGTSSKKFRQKHFDSYRNTYIGFIFQEYNILDEFSVGANIGLALQLQGRKATSEEINRILEEVDLAGYGNRKPNELSGGQKQRVAIARALVKNPQIIMADEPTGALDSVTGKQVLDTLKKLSAEKLVVVVSHDREFAEKYADRIIELADGKVISDMEYDSEGVTADEGESLLFEGNTVTIPEKYRLTEEDRKQINAYIEKLEKGEVTLTVGTRKEEKAEGRVSRPTDQSKIQLKDMSFKLIKSHLPMRFAFKMGASSLKYKKVRLVFTILLSCVAFTLFGLADTFGAYDYVTTGTQSIIDSNVNYASFVKAVKEYYGDEEDEFNYQTDNHYISKADLDEIYNRTGLRLTGVYAPISSYGQIDIDEYLGKDESYDGGYYYYSDSVYNRYVRGYSEMTLDDGLTLAAGRLPEAGTKDIAITDYTLEVFKEYGYIDATVSLEDNRKTYYTVTQWDDETWQEVVVGLEDEEGNYYPIEEFDMSIFDEGYEFDGYCYRPIYEYKEPETVTITKAEDMLGKKLLGYTIVGVVDTGLDITRYENIYNYDPDQSTAQNILNYALQEEFRNLIQYSSANVIIVPEGFIDEQLEAMKGTYVVQNGGEVMDSTNGYHLTSLNTIMDVSAVDSANVIRLDGKTGAPADDEIFLSYSVVRDNYMYSMDLTWDEDGNIVNTWDYSIIVPVDELIEKGIEPATDEAILYAIFKEAQPTVSVRTYDYKDGKEDSAEYKVAGVVMDKEYGVVYTNKNVAEKFAVKTDGDYIFAVTAMPESADEIRELVAFSDEDTEIRFEMRNAVLYELDTLRDGFEIISPIFMWIGVGFAVFASLMMSNFISTSITHKKREIGILRAIGSRSNDVFRIFFSESFIIAMINFVLTTLGVFGITTLVNSVIRNNTGLLITVLSFGVRQVVLELGVALLVAAVASFLPVKRIASKKPIDAIRDR